MIPDVSFSVEGSHLELSDYQTTMVLGGYDRLSASALGTDAQKLSVGQGSTITAYSQGSVIWEGRLASDPQIVEGLARIEAIGHRARLVKEDERLLFQSRAISEWATEGDGDTDSSNITQGADVESEVRNSVLFFRAPKEAITSGDSAYVTFWAAGLADITRYAFDIVKNRSNANFDIRTRAFDGPTGSSTVETDHPLSGAGATAIDRTLATATGFDALALGIRANANVTPANPVAVRLKNVRVNGIAPGDTYYVYQVLQYLAGQVGFDASGISTNLNLNCLPLDWQETWDSLADYAVMLQDGFHRVLEDRGSGPYWEADTWDNATNWTVSQARGARVELVPQEIFSKVQVNYSNHSGAQRRVRVSASPDPLATVGLTNVYDFDLDDPQGDNTLATAVANNLLPQVSEESYNGSIEFVEARDSAGRDAPREVKAGDTITVTDHAMGASFLHRVNEVTQNKDSVVAQVGHEPSALRVIANAMNRNARRRRGRAAARQRR